MSRRIWTIIRAGALLSSILCNEARAQVSIVSVLRNTSVTECLNVPPDYVNACETEDDDNDTTGPWFGSGLISKGDATDETNFANGEAHAEQTSDISTSRFSADSRTSTIAQSGGSCSVQVGANSTFAVHFAVLSKTNVAIDVNIVTSGGFGSATLTMLGVGTLFATADPAVAQLTLAPGQYQFIASSSSRGDCSSECMSEESCQWNVALTFAAEPCDADFNEDGFLDFSDFDDFAAAFEAGESAADFDGDGFLTFEDFDAFVAGFDAGC